MIPIGDDNSLNRTAPVVNWFPIAANILVFIFVAPWIPRSRRRR